jgi:hypothetical protein
MSLVYFKNFDDKISCEFNEKCKIVCWWLRQLEVVGEKEILRAGYYE